MRVVADRALKIDPGWASLVRTMYCTHPWKPILSLPGPIMATWQWQWQPMADSRYCNSVLWLVVGASCGSRPGERGVSRTLSRTRSLADMTERRVLCSLALCVVAAPRRLWSCEDSAAYEPARPRPLAATPTLCGFPENKRGLNHLHRSESRTRLFRGARDGWDRAGPLTAVVEQFVRHAGT